MLIAEVGMMVTTANAERVGSACETAVTVTVAGEGTIAGAVYRPLLSMVPSVGLPPRLAFTSQTTVGSVVLATVALKGWLAPNATVAASGVMVTVMAAEATIVTVAVADLLGSACRPRSPSPWPATAHGLGRCRCPGL